MIEIGLFGHEIRPQKSHSAAMTPFLASVTGAGR
jgi:hypothetical protein